MTADEIGPTLSELDERFERTDDDSEDFDDEIATIPRMDETTYLALLAKRAVTPYGALFSELRDLVIPGVIDAYVRGGADVRNAIRALFHTHRFARIALWSLLETSRWRLQKAPAQQKPALLRTLLVLASLGEDFLDTVETSHILSAAWGDAEDAGLDPAHFFAEAADLAGHQPLAHGRTASDYLRTFQPLDYGRPIRS